MDGVELWIGEQILVVPGGALDTLGVGKFPCCFGSASGNTGHLHIAEAAERFSMHPAHETDSKDGGLSFFISYEGRARASRRVAPKRLFP